MKKYFGLIVLIMISCTPSNEEKAEALIKETLKDYLYHPDSYEPISTKIDSVFTDLSIVEPILKIGNDIKDSISKIAKYESELELAETSMDIWAPNGYSSQYSRGNYARAKKEKDEAESNLEKYIKKLNDQFVCLKDNIAKHRKGEFTGWLAFHRFSSLNGPGTTSIPGEMIFFCDKEFTSCIGYEVEKLEEFVEIVNIVENATSDDDIMDYFTESGPYYD